MPGEPGASRSINWPGLPLLPWGPAEIRMLS